MDYSSNTSPRSVPTPQSPAPLALSEYMAQITPCSDTTHSDGPASHTRKPEVVEEPEEAPVQDRPRNPTPQEQPQEAPEAPPGDEESSPPPSDWLSTRQQLLPRRHQGKKGDWIRGWSHAVSSHGDAAYCACSETIEHPPSRGRKGKSSDLAGNVRAILQRAGSPSSNNNTRPIPNAEPEVCPNCSRPASPPPSPTAATSSLKSEKAYSQGARSLGKRFSNLFLRVRPLRSKSAAHKRDEEIRNMAWPESYQPQWATTGPGQKRFLARPPSQPMSAPAAGTAPKSREGGDYFAALRNSFSRGKISANAATGGGAGAGPSSSELDGSSDSDAPRPGLSRSMSRLARAAAMLQRATSRPKD